MTTELEVLPIAPHETTEEELEHSLQAGFRAIIVEADTFRPLARHVMALMRAAYAAGKRDAKK